MKKSKTNRAARTKVAQDKANDAYRAASAAALTRLIEDAKSKQVSQQAPTVPQPLLKSIVYVFGDGSVAGGAPNTLKLVQDGDNIVAINILKQEGDKVTYSPVATFVGMKMEKVVNKTSEAATATRTVEIPKSKEA